MFKRKIFWLALLTFIVWVASTSFLIDQYWSEELEIVVIFKKQNEENNSIFTDHEVFICDYYRFMPNTPYIYNKLIPGKRYRVIVRGANIPFVSDKREIIKVLEK